jgi:hypothetical protein
VVSYTVLDGKTIIFNDLIMKMQDLAYMATDTFEEHTKYHILV